MAGVDDALTLDPTTMRAFYEVLVREQLRTLFQPIVHLDSGEVVAHEASTAGPLGGPFEHPTALFRTARLLGNAVELDRVAERRTLAVARRLAFDGHHTLLLNREPEALGSTGPEEFELARRRAAGHLRVVVKISERRVLDRPAELLAAVRDARAEGWGIALDDVGENPAALSLLPLLRPDVIKLDRRLVQRAPTPEVAGMVATVLGEAERTGAAIIAEGIETADHECYARSLGATYGQGYRYGAPSPDPRVGGVVRETVRFRPAAPWPTAATPFELLAGCRPVRPAHRALLVAMAIDFERLALRSESTPVVLASFRNRAELTDRTTSRYRTLLEQGVFVATFGPGFERDPIPGVRGAPVGEDDPLSGEWAVIVLGPDAGAAFAARRAPQPEGRLPDPDAPEEFVYAVTRDVSLVAAAAEVLLRRLHAEPAATDARNAA